MARQPDSAAPECRQSPFREATLNTAAPFPLVSTDWLAEHLADPDLRVFDCSVSLVPAQGGVRLESGRAAWEAGHIPGAAYADLLADLSDRTTALPIMMPPAAQFAEAMGRYGVGPGARVVLYDDGPHVWATRLWWMLRAMGFDQAAVLDGGLRKWVAEGRPLSVAVPQHPATRFDARPRPGTFVDKDGVRAVLADEHIRVLNALSAEEHSGKIARTLRPGHIPGSANVPAASLLDPSTGGYLPLERLRETFRTVGALDARRVITYCGGGIAATSAAFTLVRLGATEVAVYDGSLVEWSADPALPMATG